MNKTNNQRKTTVSVHYRECRHPPFDKYGKSIVKGRRQLDRGDVAEGSNPELLDRPAYEPGCGELFPLEQNENV